MKVTNLKNNQVNTVQELGILVLFSGSITLDPESQTAFVVKKGSFLICDNDFEISTASPYLDGYLIDFDRNKDKRLQDILSELIDYQEYWNTFRLSDEVSIKELVSSLVKNKSDEGLIYSYAHILLSKLKEQIQSSQGNATSIFEKFRLLIDDNVQHNYCAGEYAEMLEIPITTLIQEVKREVGKTPCKVITDRVIDYAQKRLSNTNDSSKMIAYQLGFDDPYYFIKYFKKNVGVTPTQFRKQQLLETE